MVVLEQKTLFMKDFSEGPSGTCNRRLIGEANGDQSNYPNPLGRVDYLSYFFLSKGPHPAGA